MKKIKRENVEGRGKEVKHKIEEVKEKERGGYWSHNTFFFCWPSISVPEGDKMWWWWWGGGERQK